jgi:hypothetical protein
MLTLLDTPTELDEIQLHQRQRRKAHLLRQGHLLSEAYEAGQLKAMLEKLKAEQHRQTQQLLEPQAQQEGPFRL